MWLVPLFIQKMSKKNIIVSSSTDMTTKYVSEWLYFLNNNLKVITENDAVHIDSVKVGEISEFNLKIGEDIINKDEINFVFFRSGAISLNKLSGFYSGYENIMNTSDQLKYYLTTYDLAQKEIISWFFHDQFKLGKNNSSRINKIIVLEIARKSGLKIPETIVTRCKSELYDFAIKHKELITKSIDINCNIEIKDDFFMQYTSAVNIKDIESFPDVFALTLFQQLIKKSFELRIFYLNGKMYSSAIMSQMSSKTKIDYRNYDDTIPNRVVPFNLPVEIEKKIINMMNMLKLETGSIDIMVTDNGEYVFLEVNPNGQFLGISVKCNYYLDREIAKTINL